jgi:ABC-2 type transport system ATP-binding protein
MTTVIKTQNLTKEYGSLTAVKSLNLDIRKSEIYGFIGLNGAGKTTTIRMLLGMIKPTTGSVELFGEKITPNSTSIWSKVGFLVETATAYPELSVMDNLEASRRLYRLKDKKVVGEVMESLNLTQYKSKKAKYLSLGNIQRLAIAKALLQKPKLLILDEPANGLDPAGIVEIRNLLENLAENEGVTVFISSHILGEIYRFASKIGIIHEGVLIDEMDIETLNKKMRERLVLDAVNRQKLLSAVKSLGYDPSVNDAGELEISDEHVIKEPQNLVSELIKLDIPINKVNVVKEDLEQYFLSKVGKHE